MGEERFVYFRLKNEHIESGVALGGTPRSSVAFGDARASGQRGLTWTREETTTSISDSCDTVVNSPSHRLLGLSPPKASESHQFFGPRDQRTAAGRALSRPSMTAGEPMEVVSSPHVKCVER